MRTHIAVSSASKQDWKVEFRDVSGASLGTMTVAGVSELELAGQVARGQQRLAEAGAYVTDIVTTALGIPVGSPLAKQAFALLDANPGLNADAAVARIAADLGIHVTLPQYRDLLDSRYSDRERSILKAVLGSSSTPATYAEWHRFFLSEFESGGEPALMSFEQSHDPLSNEASHALADVRKSTNGRDETGALKRTGSNPTTFYVPCSSWFDSHPYDVNQISEAVREGGGQNIRLEPENGETTKQAVVVFDVKAADESGVEQTIERIGGLVQAALDTQWIIVLDKDWSNK